jgi:peptide/nickel transport system substrate-binding protein
MKNWRRVIATLLVLGLLAAGCGSDGSESTTTPAPSTTSLASTTTSTTPATTSSTLLGEHPYGGEVVIGDLEPPVTLNHYAPGGESRIVSMIGQAVWVGVADVDGFSLELVPDVVVELPSVGNGGLVVNGDGTETVEFVIDPAAVWGDGTPISGEDFRFTYETIMDPTLGVDRLGYEDIVPGSVVVGKSFRFCVGRRWW